jgi:hypothetical protein
MHNIIERLLSMTKTTRSIAVMMKKYSDLTADPIENVYLMERHVRSMEKKINALPEGSVKDELKKWFDDEAKRIEDNKEEFKIQFGKKLRSLFQEKHMETRGQYPLLRVGLYTLKLDFEFGQAILYFGPEVEKIASRISLHPQAVFKSVYAFDGELRTLERSPEEYFQDIHEAYGRTVRVQKKDMGDKVLISEVLKEFILMQQPKKFVADPQKSHFKDFSRVKLAYLLYQVKIWGATEHGLRFHVATFDATTDKVQSLWIPENDHGEGTHYAMISFDQDR